jgi:peptidoglycan/LPS O-acetylase OafA/YrhL
LVQHYWSLSVEEQFYVVWPVLLAVGLAVSRRTLVVAGVACAAIASALLMALLYRPGADPSRIYFGTDTRATALMIGVILAFVWPLGRMTAAPSRGARLVLDVVGVGGLIALLAMMHGWHDYDALLYRGGFVLAALAAAAMIAAAGHPASRLGDALGVRPLRWIGQRSYGIYLWHWPVMALTRPGIDLTWSTWILIPAQVAVTFGLAALSFRYVEMPIRRRVAWRNIRAWLDRRRPRERLLTAGGAALVALGVLAAAVIAPATQSRAAHEPLASAAARARVGLVASRARAVGAPAPIPPYTVLAVGASVMLAAEPALEQRLHAVVDAAVGRQPSAILARLREYRQAKSLPANVVVQIGDNGPIFSADLTASGSDPR